MKTRFNPFTSNEQPVVLDRTVPQAAPRKSRAGKKQQRRKRPPLSAEEALARAQSGLSLANYPAIFAGFKAKGLPESEIRPRENVFTFKAWIAQGRRVKKGEHGVKVVSVIETPIKDEVDPESGQVTVITKRRPWTSTVFHISQTEPLSTQNGRSAQPEPAPQPIESEAVETVPPAEPADHTVIPVNFELAQKPQDVEVNTSKPSGEWRARFLRSRVS